MITGNYEVIKTVNISLVLDVLRNHGELSRSDIARITGLTTGTITNIVNKLLEYGFVEEQGSVLPSTGGRKPVSLRLNAKGGYAIGIEVTTVDIHAMLFNFLAEPIFEWKVAGSFRYQQGLTTIIELIEKIKEHLGGERKKLLGVGISVPGWVDFSTGKINNLPNLPGWENSYLKNDIEQRTALPVFIDNDANLAAHGELWFGKGKSFEPMIYVLVDDGIGAGFIFNHQVYHGKGYSVGELGHISFGDSEELCRCGNKGCLDATASVKAIEKNYQKLTNESVAIDQINKRYLDGEYFAKQVVIESAYLLGKALGSFINLFGPDAIILGGKMIRQNPHYIDLAKEFALKSALPLMSQNVLITTSQLEEKSSVFGCAALVFQTTMHPFSLYSSGNHS